MRRKRRIVMVVRARRYQADHVFTLPGVRELPREQQFEDDRVW
jgi:hypothetical protein